MTRSESHKEKAGSDRQASQDDFLEGTSARTRPLSYDEIMFKRKGRGDTAKQVASGLEVADIALARENTEKTPDFPERHKKTKEDFETMDVRHTSNDSDKVSSWRKEDTRAARKNDKPIRVPDVTKLKSVIGDNNISSNRVTEGRHDRRDHSSRKKDGLFVDSENGSDRRPVRDSYKKDRVSERSRGKPEMDRKQLHNEVRQVHRKRKTGGRMGSDSENEHKKRNARHLLLSDKVIDSGRQKFEKGNRHRRHIEEDKTSGRREIEKENRHRRHIEVDKTRVWSTGKKTDSGIKGSESARTYLEESRPKRRRSRSREREDRSRRSVSHSPKGHRHGSKEKRDHVDLSSHSTKDKPGREHSDVEKKRISNNGSTSHYRRNNDSSSGLGGYSPRKRKTDAAAKTPSPTCRSPERKNAGWDLQPVENESVMAGSTLSKLQPTSQSLSLNIKEFPSNTPVTPAVVKPIGIPHHALPSKMQAIESVQLTQSTRPMRRLYVENLPASASEKDLIECINKFLMSSGVNYIQGTQPCISCIIHKEKSQGLLEFLTPEDASAALSLDGVSFSGFNLKLRRPKDYVNVTTGLADKAVAAVDSISDVVEDSPHKIFIGGISKCISSKMLLEIARAFGPVKAFHYECIADTNESCAFLEYVDHSVTSKACAGLNGMRLAGQVVTAVFATPEAVLENVGKLPFYGIPEHAKALLEIPTAVLKLKNVLDPEGILSLSESELEEILEDIRLECSRFGTVKSVNAAKPTNSFVTKEAYDVSMARSYITKNIGESINGVGQLDRSEPPEILTDLEDNSQTVEDSNGCDISRVVGESLSNEIIADNLVKDEMRKQPSNDESISVKDSSNQENSSTFTEEFANNDSVVELENNDNISTSTSERNTDMENKPLVEEELEPEQHNAEIMTSQQELNLEENNSKIESSIELDSKERRELDVPEEGDKHDKSIDLELVFEPGSVFVEYRRVEAACMAAHCLHGRLFDGRVVTVGYVDHDLYQRRFCR